MNAWRDGLTTSEQERYDPQRGTSVQQKRTRIPPARRVSSAGHQAGFFMDQDQARLLPRYRLERQQATILRAHTPPDRALPDRTYIADAGGDARQLRGIPAIGRNVAGHIPGTQPEQAATR